MEALRRDRSGVAPFVVAILAVLLVVAFVGVAWFFLRPGPLGCSKGFYVHARNIDTGQAAGGVPLKLTSGTTTLATGSTNLLGDALFVSVPCSQIGFVYGGGNWVLYNPVVVDTTVYAASIIDYNIAVAACGQPPCTGG